MLVDIQWLEKKYDELSHLFGGRMPNVEFKLTKELHDFGKASCTFRANGNKVYASDFVLMVSNAYDTPEDVKVNVLLHEMIHIYDYYNFPYHFAKATMGNLKWVKGYDAHGDVLFVPMMNKINSKGFNVTVKIGNSELPDSRMSDDTVRRLSKPFLLCYADYGDPSKKNMFFMCTEKTLHNIEKRYSQPEWNRFAPKTITYYTVSSVSLRNTFSMTIGDRINGYICTEEKWAYLLAKCNLLTKRPDGRITFGTQNTMNEQKNRKIIKLTESDIRKIISEAISEIMSPMRETEPIDGGNAVAKQVAQDTIEASLV